MIVLSALFAPTAYAQTPPDNPRDRQMITFYVWPSALDMTGVKKYAKEEIAKATAANRPILPRVAMLPGMTVISLESVAICDSAKGCPLLVFRDIAKSPTLKDFSYQNIVIIYRPKATVLVLTSSGPDRDCTIPKLGKARCIPSPKK